MECKAEDPTGHLLPGDSSLVLRLSKFGEGMCKNNVFLAGWLVTLPLDPLISPAPSKCQCSVDCTKGVVGWVTSMVNCGWEGLIVAIANI